MKIQEIETLELPDVKKLYKHYLEQGKFSKSTITVSSSDAFYIWNHGSRDIFWNVVTNNGFENIARETLNELLTKNSKGNTKKNINSYLAHLRRFRKFLAEYNSEEFPLAVKEKTIIERKQKPQPDIPTPSCEVVDYYLTQWDDLENYHLQEEALNKLFFKLAPLNDDISDILLKVSTLNDFYSTNIFSTYPVAKHIQSLKIDERLARGDLSLVNDIQRITIGKKTRNLYSFATKYCSHHNPKAFAIYDSYVDKVLRYFKDRDEFASFSAKDLKRYERFYAILIDFRDYYHLERYSLKKIDQYLWQLGKQYFKRKYY